jgi:hypothetical protein
MDHARALIDRSHIALRLNFGHSRSLIGGVGVLRRAGIGIADMDFQSDSLAAFV